MRVIVLGCYRCKSGGAECFSSNFSVQNFLQCQTVSKQRAKELLWAATCEVTRRDCTRMFGFGLYRILPFFLTGAVAAVVTTPFDVAKTRVMLAKVQSPLDILCFEFMINKYILTLKDQCVTKQPSLECYWERHSVCVKGGKCSGVSLTCLFVCLFVWSRKVLPLLKLVLSKCCWWLELRMVF